MAETSPRPVDDAGESENKPPPTRTSVEETQQELLATVGEKEQRKIQARQQQNGVWFGLGMFGMIGWSVAVPVLLGVALGLWLDRRWPGPQSWTLMLLFAGFALGCANAWYWVRREHTPGADRPRTSEGKRERRERREESKEKREESKEKKEKSKEKREESKEKREESKEKREESKEKREESKEKREESKEEEKRNDA